MAKRIANNTGITASAELYDCLEAADYRCINDLAYQTACSWFAEIGESWLIYDGNNVGRWVENLLYTKILRGAIEKVYAFSEQGGKECRGLLGGENPSPSGGVAFRVKEAVGRYWLPLALRHAEAKPPKKAKERRLLFAFTASHKRAIESLRISDSYQSILVSSIIDSAVPLDSLRDENVCLIDCLTTWQMWKRYKDCKARVHAALSDEELLQTLRSRFVCNGISYFDLIREELTLFLENYIPNSIRYYELSKALLDRYEPSVLVFGDDASHRARAAISAGRRRGIPSVLLQHGIVASKELYYPFADRMAVWGENSFKTLTSNGVSAEKVTITGAGFLPFNRPQESETTGKDILIISSPAPTGYGKKLVTKTVEIARTLRSFVDSKITIKVHPFECPEEYRNCLEKTGVDASVVHKCNLSEYIYASAVVITYYSTVAIESILLGTPVICVASEFPEDSLLHEQNILYHCQTLDEVPAMVKFVLDNRSDVKSRIEMLRADFLNRYCSHVGAEATDNVEKVIAAVTKKSTGAAEDAK